MCAILSGGAFAERAVVHQAAAWRLPQGLDLACASAVPVVYGTADLALRHRAGLTAGQTVLVLGAAGGVGLAAVQVRRGSASCNRIAALLRWVATQARCQSVLESTATCAAPLGPVNCAAHALRGSTRANRSSAEPDDDVPILTPAVYCLLSIADSKGAGGARCRRGYRPAENLIPQRSGRRRCDRCRTGFAVTAASQAHQSSGAQRQAPHSKAPGALRRMLTELHACFVSPAAARPCKRCASGALLF